MSISRIPYADSELFHFGTQRTFEGKARIIVLCCKIPFMQYGEEDLISQKIAMLQLYLNGFANQKQIAQGFGIHPNTMSNLVRSYERRGNCAPGKESEKS